MHSFDFLHVNMTGTFWSCRDKMLYLKERPGYSVPAPLSLLIAELSPCCVHAHKIKHLLMKKSISYKLLNSMEYKNVQTNYNYLSNKIHEVCNCFQSFYIHVSLLIHVQLHCIHIKEKEHLPQRKQ